MAPVDKLCMVCSDKALGYNFNAVTCESCKAFFRRNALSRKEFVCAFNKNCDITVITRRFCQKCRLEKCLSIGMRKEYIMSEEDKILKKMKIEQNRSKRKPTSMNVNDLKIPTKIKREVAYLMEEEEYQQQEEQTDKKMNGEYTNTHMEDYKTKEEYNSSYTKVLQPITTLSNQFVPITKVHLNHHHHQEFENMFPVISSSTEITSDRSVIKSMPNLDSSSTDIVDRLVNYPEDASKLINHLMKTPADAVAVMTKILNSQKDAMRLIGHLIGSPGDALKIISKIMNSPFDALTVFTKFMSSPTDALEIIAKIASSPGEVLQFIQQLMHSPEDALQIMNKFMNSPAEALKMLNKMVNNPSVDSTTQLNDEPTIQHPPYDVNDNDDKHSREGSINENNPMLKSMLSAKSKEITITANGLSSEEDLTNNGVHFSCDSNLKIPSQNYSTCNNSTFMGCNNANTDDASETIRSILQDVSDDTIVPNTLESVICEAIKLEYDAVPANNNNRDLNDAERAKLNELIVAFKALYAPVDEDLTGLDECSIKVQNI